MASESNSNVAVKHNITCKRGDTFSRIFKYWADSAKTVPVDITGSTFELKVFDEKREKEILRFTAASGLAISDTNTLTLSKTKTEMLLRPGVYIYDLEKTTGAVGLTIMEGDFNIVTDVPG